VSGWNAFQKTRPPKRSSTRYLRAVVGGECRIRESRMLQDIGPRPASNRGVPLLFRGANGPPLPVGVTPIRNRRRGRSRLARLSDCQPAVRCLTSPRLRAELLSGALSRSFRREEEDRSTSPLFAFRAPEATKWTRATNVEGLCTSPRLRMSLFVAL